jgi:hypothetical protein
VPSSHSNGFGTPLPVTGAYYRIHAVHSLSTIVNPITGANRTCQFPSMVDQIGCLVEASPCSLGFSLVSELGNIAQNNNVSTGSVNNNNQTPLPACIQSGAYPL